MSMLAIRQWMDDHPLPGSPHLIHFPPPSYQHHHHHRNPSTTPHPFTFQQLNQLALPLRPEPQHVEVSWRPPQTFLHYHELYCGIYEYLRAPPDPEHHEGAVEYLTRLRHNRTIYRLLPSVLRLQDHRILWVMEWLKAMPDDVASDSDTIEHA